MLRSLMEKVVNKQEPMDNVSREKEIKGESRDEEHGIRNGERLWWLVSGLDTGGSVMSTESSQTEKQREKKKRTDDLRTVEQLQKVYQMCHGNTRRKERERNKRNIRNND